jgi:hypothetical protein
MFEYEAADVLYPFHMLDRVGCCSMIFRSIACFNRGSVFLL